MRRHETAGIPAVSSDPRVNIINFIIFQEKKLREREERIRKEKEELEKLESYNPFGKGGAGAPFRDRDGNVVSNRRPFSQVRTDIVGGGVSPILQNSQSNKNINYPPNNINYG